MDRYVKGLLTAYDRILNLIDLVDPEHVDARVECLRCRINASLAAYKLFLTKEDIDKYESESENKIKSLEGTLTLNDIDIAIAQLVDAPNKCKILNLPDNYFN